MIKPIPDHCMTLKSAAEYLEFVNKAGEDYKYGAHKIRNLIAMRKIEATVKPRGGVNTRNDWCVSFNSVEKWRKKNL